jgi:23S rRNA (guanosine2251-2'-O)-methyltransferase
MKTKHAILVLENIRSAQNVGSIFRTADAAGISKMYIVGYTPDPLDRFGRPRGDIAKAALGAEQTIPWEHVKTISPLLKKLKKEGFQIIAIEQSPNSVDYKKIKNTQNICFVLGNEVTGVSKAALAQADVIAEIPMRGDKESLNVSVAGGIAMFRILNV